MQQTDGLNDAEPLTESQGDAPENRSESEDSAPVCENAAREGALFEELPTCGPDANAGLRDALASLTGRPELNATVTGERSVVFWRAVEPLKRELLGRVRQDAGGSDDAPETLQALQEAFVEASLFRRAMWLRLAEGPNPGPVTGKGRTKALYQCYVQAIDREAKLAQAIGLTRKRRPVPSVSDLLRSDHDD